MDTDCTAPRASCARGRYHRAGAWLADLSRLAAGGLSDGQISRRLSLMHAPARWTRRQVWYWRTRADERNEGPRNPNLVHEGSWETRAQVRAVQARLFQARQGWAHLLPDYGPGGRGWVGGHELSRTEVRILSLVRDRGPQTARQLRRALGLVSLYRHGGRYLLTGLVRAGLLARQGFPPAYRLTPEAGHDHRTPARRTTGLFGLV